MLHPTGVGHAIRRKRDSFTLIELLTVILIIAILAGLSLEAGFALMNQGARSRARGEIQALSAGLESYKTDNGIYVQSDGLLTTNNYASDTSSTLTSYQPSSQALFTNLVGMNYYAQSALNVDANNNPVKSYMNLKINQVGNATGPISYVKDPWNLPYGYSTGDNKSPETAYPYNGTGFFDLWATGGLSGAGVTNINTWISNWTQ